MELPHSIKGGRLGGAALGVRNILLHNKSLSTEMDMVYEYNLCILCLCIFLYILYIYTVKPTIIDEGLRLVVCNGVAHSGLLPGRKVEPPHSNNGSGPEGGTLFCA